MLEAIEAKSACKGTFQNWKTDMYRCDSDVIHRWKMRPVTDGKCTQCTPSACAFQVQSHPDFQKSYADLCPFHPFPTLSLSHLFGLSISAQHCRPRCWRWWWAWQTASARDAVEIDMPRSSADSSDEESKPPTAEEVDEFIRHNKVDESAAQDLRECPPEVQKRVLGRGDLNSARNPSAAVLVRIRDARVEERPSGRTLRPMGLPSSAEVNTYIKANGVNEAAAAALRGCSPTVKRAVLSSGDVTID
eukprot:s1619_g4.t1